VIFPLQARTAEAVSPEFDTGGANVVIFFLD
jgi:hypothetical protein